MASTPLLKRRIHFKLPSPKESVQNFLSNMAILVAIPITILEFLKKHDTMRKLFIAWAIGIPVVHLLFPNGGLATLLSLAMLALNFVYAIFFMVVQFGSLFWFMGRTRTTEIHPGDPKAETWDDYWGQKHLVERVKQWNKILIDRETFAAMGGQALNGLLMTGPPGTGKTKMAKALAGSGGVAFLGTEGSTFRGMFWGVDTMKVMGFVGKARKLAKRYGACIAYIDEIDAIGTSRGNVQGQGGQTQGAGPMGMMGSGALTRLLYEMDGIALLGLWGESLDRARAMLLLKPLDRGKVMFMGASVTGDTPVMVWGRGLVSIGELIDDYFNDGESETEKPVDGLFVLGMNQRTVWKRKSQHAIRYRNAEFQPVRSVYRHRVDKIYDVEFTGGHKIGMTADHSVFVVGSHGQIAPKAASELEAGDKLVDLPRVTWGRGKKSRMSPVNLPKASPMTPVGQLSVDLAFFLGLWLAEGYIHQNKSIDICLGLHEKDLIERTLSLMKQWSAKTYEKSTKLGGAVNLGCYNTALAKWIKAEFGSGSHGKHLPAWAFTLPDNLFDAMLDGWLVGDGSNHSGGNSRVGVTVSARLAKDFAWACRMHSRWAALNSQRYNGFGKGVAYNVNIQNNTSKVGHRAKVVSVQRRDFDGYVYDLCGCEGEAFYGGEIPVLLHNTNRPDVLDPALLRPGRFDQIIQVDEPDEEGRREVIEGYLGRIVHDDDIDVESLVADTPRASPAHIMSVITKDAVRSALFDGRTSVNQEDLELSFQEKLIGIANPISNWDPEQKRAVAAHEAGHAIAMRRYRPDNRFVRLSIIRRGRALGYALDVRRVDVFAHPQSDWVADIYVSMAGDIGANVIMGERWTGMGGDMMRVREKVFQLFAHGAFGSFPLLSGQEPGKAITKAVDRFMDKAVEVVDTYLRSQISPLEALTDALFEREDMTGADAIEIMKAATKGDDNDKSYSKE